MRLSYDLEAALVAVVDCGGEAQDPALRALALDALEVAGRLRLPWVAHVTVMHLPDDGGVPYINVEWKGG